MKKSDWLFAALLLGMGLICLTVSATSLLERPSESYFRTLLTLCAWIGAPLVLLGGIYLFLNRSNKKEGTRQPVRDSKNKK